VDEGRGTHAEDARARANEDNGDRAQAQAERGCGVSAGIKARRDAGSRSREERGVRGASGLRAITIEAISGVGSGACPRVA
jgi:hypothetical protein